MREAASHGRPVILRHASALCVCSRDPNHSLPLASRAILRSWVSRPGRRDRQFEQVGELTGDGANPIPCRRRPPFLGEGMRLFLIALATLFAASVAFVVLAFLMVWPHLH